MDVSLRELQELVMDREAGVLWFMGSQRVRHDWAIEMNWTELRLEKKLAALQAHNDSQKKTYR